MYTDSPRERSAEQSAVPPPTGGSHKAAERVATWGVCGPGDTPDLPGYWVPPVGVEAAVPPDLKEL